MINYFFYIINYAQNCMYVYIIMIIFKKLSLNRFHLIRREDIINASKKQNIFFLIFFTSFLNLKGTCNKISYTLCYNL